ncbi:hypothetical protein BRD17_02690 [Halobacteriales archaeon SW_7_68_16]|nr:MAG: hypothetical protein BRD17_02690 [Halobacteriales archaeon SW_7_68_16]
MTRVCLVGAADVDLRYELLSRETARDALATYDLDAPYENTVAVSTVSLGAAVALCNDLDWYLTRFADAALVHDPSVADEWLSRALAAAIRDGRIDPDATGDRLRIYGVADGRLVDPMYVRRSDGRDATTRDEDDGGDDAGAGRVDDRNDGDDSVPAYDLQEVEDTLVVRVTEPEFGA